jgi:hypothetical protein
VFRTRGTSLSWCRSGFDHLGRPRMVDWSNEPDVALSGEGGHSVHGHDGPWCPRPPFDGDGQNWVAERGDEQKVMKISRLGFS